MQLGFHWAAAEVPACTGSCPCVGSTVIMPCNPAGRWGDKFPGFQYLFGKPESKVPFFVSLFKTLNYCHLDVQVSIKLCKDNRTCACRNLWFYSVIQRRDWQETSSRGLFQSFRVLAHTENGTSLTACGWVDRAALAVPRVEDIPLTHPVCTQFGRLWRSL